MRKLLLSISFLLISFTNYSQNAKTKFGVQAGLNYSNFYGYEVPLSPLYSESPAFAFLGGLNFEYQIKEGLSFKTELSYERKSQKADNTVEIIDPDGFPTVYSYTSKKNSDYLVLPVMLKYSFTDKNSFYVNGGPYIGYLLKSNVTSNLNISEFSNETLVTTNGNKRTDFGLSFGIGKNFELSEKKMIFIEIRENLGLAKTNKFESWDSRNVKTNSLNLIIGYCIN